jgi:hypothetical protein
MSPTQTQANFEYFDCDAVSSAATLLGLREFEYFRLAYRRWFGEQPYPERLERAFVDYMMRQHIPPWVRMLTWQVMDAERTGTLEPTAFGAERYRDRPKRASLKPVYLSGLAAVFLLSVMAVMEIRSRVLPGDAETACAANLIYTADRGFTGPMMALSIDAPCTTS